MTFKKIREPSVSILFADSAQDYNNTYYSYYRIKYNVNAADGLSVRHSKSANIAFADGHVAASRALDVGTVWKADRAAAKKMGGNGWGSICVGWGCGTFYKFDNNGNRTY